MESLEGRKLLAIVGGVDPYNMGKGDWIWQIASAQTSTGTSSVSELATYLKNRGMKWIIVKAGDGNNGPGTGLYAQWNKSLIDTFHAAGLKVFGYHFTYGGVTPNGKNAPTTLAGEKTVRDKIMSFNPDGLIIDAEGEWERNPNANRDAEDYAKTFKQKFPSKLLGHAPFPYVRFHKSFPYLGFGKWVDVVMPQVYWQTISIAQTPEKIMSDLNVDWKNLYNEFAAGGNSSAIKPIVPIGQGYNPSDTNRTPGASITRFFDLLRNDPDPASPFGYNGASFWSVQHHTAEHWQAIGNGTINAATGSIAGKVFNDVDGDGIQDVSEVGVANRIVYDDTNNDGKRQNYEPFSKTNSQGNYQIPYRPGGVHRVRQVVPSGWRQTSPSNSLSNTVTLSTGQAATGKNFGATQLGEVVGQIYNDADADGIKDSSELPLGGWRVFADADNDGVLDAGEISAVTNSNGSYVLTLPIGTYQIRQMSGSGFRCTTPKLGFYDAVAVTGGSSTIRFFGNTTLTLISGFVFNDKNVNGLKESGESGLSGWRVFADANGDGNFDSGEVFALTDSTGKYRLGTLPPGTYRIQVVVNVTQYQPTLPGSAARKITLASGGTTSNKNFGVVQIT
ncbi:MAG: SdrD B-like domain-containing protein [Tepidisphaeraceae bacterium]